MHAPAKPKSANVAPINQAYGELCEDLHFTGYAFERGCHRLRKLLSGDDWKQCGRGFVNVDDFLNSLQLDQFAKVTEERREIAKLIKALRPDVSNRAIGRALKVDEKQVRNYSAPKAEKAKQNNDGVRTKSAPTLAGAAVAKIGLRKEQAEQQRQDNADVALRPVALPADKFGTIVIDPPWEMEKIERDVRPNQVAFDYPTMSVGEIMAFRGVIDAIAADDCHLFMWTTQKFLPSAYKIIEAWDFRYVVTMVWRKPGGFQPIGLPQYNCEFVIYARSGTPRFIDTKAFDCCFDGERREHSRKPDEFYDLIARVTAGPRIDMFSREARDGFARYGNELERFDEVVT